MTDQRPGRDRRAVRHPAPTGAPRVAEPRHVVVVGGGIAGIAAAASLADRGVRVTLVESTSQLGGRVAAWPLEDGRTMSRGFHAFFRQYYNLRGLLRRIDPGLGFLVPIEDYPLIRPDGLRDSFTGLSPTPPWSILQFVLRSPAFTARAMRRVNIGAALEMLRVRFPETYSDYDGVSAADFLDRLRFPAEARSLMLEVFARSFFADPTEFSAGELVAMFHTYFLGSAEGLLFDVPDDDYDTTIWAPLGRHLAELGVDVRLDTRATALHLDASGARVDVVGSGADASPETLEADAVVLATDPRVARHLIADLDDPALAPWQTQVAATVNSPPFTVVRLWLDTPVDAGRPAFLGTAGFGPLDNISVLERFEAGAAEWAKQHHGSVVELHAYACAPDVVDGEGEPLALSNELPAAGSPAHGVVDELEAELHRAWPETAAATVLHREVLVQDDCTLVGLRRWEDRPGVVTPSDRLVLAGDWVRCGYPVALMERAATTGLLAANELLAGWGVAGADVWTVPMSGLLRRRRDGVEARP